jgi:hypothetical protein
MENNKENLAPTRVSGRDLVNAFIDEAYGAEGGQTRETLIAQKPARVGERHHFENLRDAINEDAKLNGAQYFLVRMALQEILNPDPSNKGMLALNLLNIASFINTCK